MKAVELNEMVAARLESTPAKHEKHGDFEYFKHWVVPKDSGNAMTVALMEVPPHRAAYPYHYHMNATETFYIICGSGVVRTPDGEREVKPGDVLVFPPNGNGAHRIENRSDAETLVYLDCDTVPTADVIFYPDSDKVGYSAPGKEQTFFKLPQQVNYYEGE